MNMVPVYLNQISTAVPTNEIHQTFLSYIPHLLSEPREQKVFQKLAAKAQIQTRYTCLKPASLKGELDGEEFYARDQFPSTAKRMAKYKSSALELARKAVAPLFENVRPDLITHLIVTSCTGSYAPGLDLELLQAFSLRSDAERTMIGFMGCYAAINGLKSAFHIVRSQPSAKVLLVNLELCTLHLQQRSDFESLLSFLQFADGCAASIISADKVGLELVSFKCEVIPENKDLIQWHVGDSGFDMKLSLDVPRTLGAKLSEMAPSLTPETKIWAVHPGGRSVLDAAQTSLGLQDKDLRHSRGVLSDFGNMSSATVMFVLKRILEDQDLQGPGLAMAFGPGLTLEMCRFQKPMRD
jgi:alpha-pyrone synthase